jgi:hypothetical protein
MSAAPSHPHRRSTLAVPKSATTTAQMDYTCRQHPLGLDLVQNRARGTKLGLPRQSAATGRSSVDLLRRTVRPFIPGREIRDGWMRLDRARLDLSREIEIQGI